MTKNKDIANILDQNTVFSATVTVGTASVNAFVNSTAIVVGNTSVNVTINSTAFSGSSNNAAYLGGTVASGYQTTAGLSANVATLSANNATYLGGGGALGNTTGVYANTVVNAASHTIGTTVTANSTVVNAPAINITGQVNTATFFATTTANVGANVQANTTAIFIGNTSVNVVANSTSIKLSNSTSNTTLSVPSTTAWAGDYFLHANGTWAEVIAGATPGGSNTYVQYNDSTALGGTAGFTFNETTNTVSISNTLTVGANLAVSTADVKIGNATVNGTANSVCVIVSNSSGTASLSPIEITVGDAVINSTTILANAFYGPPVSAAANGYTYLINGIIMQWGWVLSNTSVGDVTFPIAFPSAVYSYSVTGNTSTTTYKPAVVAATTSTMNVRTANDTATNCHWISIGK